jgi:hypothetical protein
LFFKASCRLPYASLERRSTQGSHTGMAVTLDGETNVKLVHR